MLAISVASIFLPQSHFCNCCREEIEKYQLTWIYHNSRRVLGKSLISVWNGTIVYIDLEKSKFYYGVPYMCPPIFFFSLGCSATSISECIIFALILLFAIIKEQLKL